MGRDRRGETRARRAVRDSAEAVTRIAADAAPAVERGNRSVRAAAAASAAPTGARGARLEPISRKRGRWPPAIRRQRSLRMPLRSQCGAAQAPTANGLDLGGVIVAHVIQPTDEAHRAPAAPHMGADEQDWNGAGRERDERRPLQSEERDETQRAVGADARVLHDREYLLARAPPPEAVAGIREAVLVQRHRSEAVRPPA